MSGQSFDMRALIDDLWFLRRDIACDDMSRALGWLADRLGFQVEGYESGSEAWTWIIPPRWEVERAHVKAGGETLVDLRDHPLHVMSYSQPVDRKVSREELLAHLRTREDRPGAISFEYSYYRPDWAFSVPHDWLPRFRHDEYEVLIDSRFVPGDLEVACLHLPGRRREEFVFMAHMCHPAMVNDDLSGVAVLAAAAHRLGRKKDRRFSYRFLVGPETIGTIAYLSRHEDLIPDMKGGCFLEMLGNQAPLSFQHSRSGDNQMDLALSCALKSLKTEHREGAFREVIVNDEAVLDGPGVDVPCCSLSRSGFFSRQEWPYPEYHTSDDTPDIISMDRLDEAAEVICRAVEILEQNFVPKRKFKGPVFLSRYDLWVDWRVNMELNLKMDDVMCMLDGDLDLLHIAESLDLDFFMVKGWLDKFAEHGLIDITSQEPR